MYAAAVRYRLVLPLLLLGASCRDSDVAASGHRAPGAAAALVVSVPGLVPARSAEPSAVDWGRALPRADESTAAYLERILPHGEPALFGPLAGLELGATGTLALRGQTAELISLSGLAAGVELRFSASPQAFKYPHLQDRINLAELRLPPGLGRQQLERAWGPPLPGLDPSGALVLGSKLPALYWFAPGRGLRAVLVEQEDGARLSLCRYLPLRRLLGRSRERLGFEPEERPLLGLPIETFARAYGPSGSRVADNLSILTLPPAEFDTYPVQVRLSVAAGVITRLRVPLGYGNRPEQRGVILQALAAKYDQELAGAAVPLPPTPLARTPQVLLREQPDVQLFWLEVSR